MTEQTEVAALNSKLEFLRNVLDAAEKRRDAVENKASILIAASAILLAALGSFDLPVPGSGGVRTWNMLAIGLLAATVVSVVLSILCALNVLAAFTPKKRQQVMKVTPDEFNVFFLGKIAAFRDAAVYQDAIESLTQDAILAQLTRQAYNLSRLVMERYKWFHRAQRLLVLSVLLFLAFVTVILFVPQ